MELKTTAKRIVAAFLLAVGGAYVAVILVALFVVIIVLPILFSLAYFGLIPIGI